MQKVLNKKEELCTTNDKTDSLASLVEIDKDILTCVKEVLRGGIAFILCDKESDFSISVHRNLVKDFEVQAYYRDSEDKAISIPEGCALIIAIGDMDTISRAKLLALSFDTRLIVFPTSFCLAKIADSVSEIDYGGIVLSRIARAPDKILLCSELYENIEKDSFVNITGELFGSCLNVCDYLYRSIKVGQYRDDLANVFLEKFDDFIDKYDRLKQSPTSDFLSKIVEINEYLSVFGLQSGASQLSNCLSRYLKKQAKQGIEKGDRDIFCAYLLSVVYSKFCGLDTKYMIPDINYCLDKTKKLFSLSEKECASLGVSLFSENYRFEDYIVKVYKEELMRVTSRCREILKKAFNSYRKMLKDGGYSMRDTVSVNQMKELVSSSPFCIKEDTLLGYIKERGLLEFENNVF